MLKLGFKEDVDKVKISLNFYRYFILLGSIVIKHYKYAVFQQLFLLGLNKFVINIYNLIISILT